MTTLTEYKFKTEVLGHTIRVIDEEGNDVIVIGSVQNPENIALANLFAAAPRMLSALYEVSEIAPQFFAVEQAIKAAEGRIK